MMMHRCLQAAAQLEKEGISVEVIDPRSLVPFDYATLKSSTGKTGRLVIVEESPKRSGIGAEIAATMTEESAATLIAPIKRIAAPNTVVPFSPPMENYYIPQVQRICSEIRDMIRN
jgi:pyruvate dehydrogenase E1 component beta subunit